MENRLSQLKTMLTDDPADSFLNYALGLEYWKAGDKDHAHTHLTFIRQNDPDYLAAYYQLGKVAQELGRIEEALTVFEEGMAVARKQEDVKTLEELQSARRLAESGDLDDEDEEEAFS